MSLQPLRPIERLPDSIRHDFENGRIPADATLVELRSHIGRAGRELSEKPTFAHYSAVCTAILNLLDSVLRQGSVERDRAVETIWTLVGFLESGVQVGEDVEKDIGRLLEVVRSGRQGPAGRPGQLHLVDRRRLGEILLTLSIISHEDLRSALTAQQISGRRVGEVLIEMGLIRRDQLETALVMQQEEEKKSSRDTASGE